MRYARKALGKLRFELERWPWREFLVVMLIAGALLLGAEAGKAQGPPGDACDPEIGQGLMESATAGDGGEGVSERGVLDRMAAEPVAGGAA